MGGSAMTGTGEDIPSRATRGRGGHKPPKALLRTWARLLRLPNLFTVPGDAVAGFLLGSGGAFGWDMAAGVGAVLCLYAGGLLLNDFFDRETDARERPERPIPSGAVHPTAVLVAGLVLLFGGVAVAWLGGGREPGIVAGLLAVAVVAYDAGLKRLRWLGPVVMGSCRAGSVLLGGSLAGGLGATGVLLAAGVALAYTAALTVLAFGEAGGRPVGRAAFVPAAVLVAAGVVAASLLRLDGAERLLAIAPLLLAVVHTARAGRAACDGRLAVPPFIGLLIRSMVLVQLAWSLWPIADGPFLATLAVCVAFCALRVAAGVAARRFYGS